MKALGVLRDPSFRRLWLAGQLSVLGTQVGRIGLVLHLFQAGHPPTVLALLIVLETLPGALAAPLAGAAVDRTGKQRVLVAAGVARAGVMLALLLHPTLPAVLVAAGLTSVVGAFFQPARAAAIPLVVPRERLADANGADQVGWNAALIAGPVLGAQLVLGAGLAATLLADAALYLSSALAAAGVRVRATRAERPRLSAAALGREVREGWRYLVGHPLALHLSLLLFVALACTGMWAPLAPFFIRDHLGAAEEVLGWQLAVFGWGTVAGGMAAPRLVERFGAGIVLYAGFLAEAASLTGYALARDLHASTAIIFVWGVVVSLVVVPFYTILQSIVEERFLGRVFSVVKQSEDGALGVSMLGVVLLQGAFGSAPILLGTGGFYLAVTAASTFTRSGRVLVATR